MRDDDASSATELMNRTYRFQRHFYDFTRKYYILGRDRLIEQLNAGPADRILEIGCATGRNLILTAPEILTSAIDAIESSRDASRAPAGDIRRVKAFIGAQRIPSS